jgi:transcriptional regulator with XRE-family HTH domain
MAGGRKDRYESFVKPYLSEIEKKTKEGVTEAEIAKALGVAVSTFNKYKLQHPELVEALRPKGAEKLDALVNAGVEAGIGYYKENETTRIVIGPDGDPKKEKTIVKTWYPPNPSLNRFYVLNFGKGRYYDNPSEYDLKKARQELDEELLRNKNWQAFLGVDREEKEDDKAEDKKE